MRHMLGSQPRGSMLKEEYLIALTLGELLASTEAITRFYMQNTKEYIEMKTRLQVAHPAMREKLWLISNTKNSMKKFQDIVESLQLSVLIEYRKFERDNIPALET